MFKQRNLPVELLVSNLRLLLQNSTLDVTCSVSLEDLDKVVGASVDETATSCVSDTVDEMDDNDAVEYSSEVQVSSSCQSGPWPPKLGDHLAVNFEDGFYIGEVIEIVSDEVVKVSYMMPKKIVTATT